MKHLQSPLPTIDGLQALSLVRVPTLKRRCSLTATIMPLRFLQAQPIIAPQKRQKQNFRAAECFAFMGTFSHLGDANNYAERGLLVCGAGRVWGLCFSLFFQRVTSFWPGAC
jgi:hypothetical protein